MRHSFLIFISLFLLCSSVMGNHVKEIELSFDVNDFVFNQSNGSVSISSSKYPIQYGTKDQEPGLPYVIIHVLVSENAKYENVGETCSQNLCKKNIIIGYNPHYTTRTSTPSLSFEQKEVKYERDTYPIGEKMVQYGGTHIVDGYKYVTLLISPFRYDFSKKELYLNNQLSLHLYLSQEKSQHSLCYGRAMRNVVRNIVINKEDIQSLYPEKAEATKTGNDDFDYLIITSENLKGAFQKLANWKNRKGVKTKIITDLEIAQSFSPIDIQGIWTPYLRYKRAIKYYNENYGVKYVLLGGDPTIIPSVKCYVEYDYLNGMMFDNTPCDYFYSCTGSSGAPFEWNCMSGDGKIGSYNDLIDYYPQVVLTRVLASSVSEASVLVDRIIAYERNPQIDIEQKSILMSGAEFNSTIIENGVYVSDAQYKGESILGQIRSWSNWTLNSAFRFYDTYTDHAIGGAYDLTGQHLEDQLANGFSFFHMDTHGSARKFGLEKINTVADSFAIYNAQSYSNSRHTLVVTSACRTNAFDSIPCLSRAMMSNPNGGIIAYWGASCNIMGIDNERQYGPIDLYNLAFYNKLFTDNEKHFGELSIMTKLHFINQYDSLSNDHNMPYTNPYRWLMFSMNPIGDPEMPIYTDTPMEFQPHNIYQNYDGSVYVNVSPTADKVCIMSLDDNGESYYSVETWPGSGADLDLPSGHDYSICFTRSGYKPYVLNIYQTGIIQNDTIANDAVVLSNYVQIGKNVTTTRPYGDVLLERGDMYIMSPQGAYIKNNFTMKKGATLTIDPSMQEVFYP